MLYPSATTFPGATVFPGVDDPGAPPLTAYGADDFTGTNGAAWSASKWALSTYGAGSATIQSNRGVLTTDAGAYAAGAAAVYIGDFARSDSEVYLELTTPATAVEQYVQIALRAQGTSGGLPDDCYYAEISMTSAFINIRRRVAGVTSNPTGAAGGYSMGANLATSTTYAVRFRLDGGQVRFRIWQAGTTEPSVWAHDVTDTAPVLTAGRLCLSVLSGSVAASRSWSLDNMVLTGATADTTPTAGTPTATTAAAVVPPFTARRPVWTAVSRTAGYQLAVTLPILGAQLVLRHLGVGSAVLTTDYTAERWASLGPSCGLVLYRDGSQRFTGRVSSRTLDWDRAKGTAVIKVEALHDTTVLAGRLTFPDPLRAPDDQTVNDYWMTRTGTTPAAVPASTAMWRLISDQAGPTCAASRQVSGLAMGADPGVGTSRIWSALFLDVLDTLLTMSVASGQNLGVRMVTTPGALTASIVVPANSGMKFSADLSNLVGFSYREEAPTVTNAVAAGQGDLHARLRKTVATTDPLATAWGLQRWSYIDRRDTAVAADLTTAATDEVTKGAPKVSLTVQLTDSQAATWVTDWDLGSIVTVYVGLPDQTRVATVTDVVREIEIGVDATGAETIRPAIGTFDATSVIPTPSQAQLARIGVALGNLIAGK